MSTMRVPFLLLVLWAGLAHERAARESPEVPPDTSFDVVPDAAPPEVDASIDVAARNTLDAAPNECRACHGGGR